jgi:hypothetical protein
MHATALDATAQHVTAVHATTVDESSSMLSEPSTLNLDGLVLDEATLVNSPVLPYVRMVVSLLEGRTIRCEELVATLFHSIRQRSMGRLPHREYVLRYLNRYPP